MHSSVSTIKMLCKGLERSQVAGPGPIVVKHHLPRHKSSSRFSQRGHEDIKTSAERDGYCTGAACRVGREIQGSPVANSESNFFHLPREEEREEEGGREGGNKRK